MFHLRIYARMAAIAATGVLIASLAAAVPVSAAMTQAAANKRDRRLYLRLSARSYGRHQRTSHERGQADDSIAAPIGQFSNSPSFRHLKTTLSWRRTQIRFILRRGSICTIANRLPCPRLQSRYFLMPMLDMWTNVFQSPGRGPDMKGRRLRACRATLERSSTGRTHEDPSATSTIWIIGRSACYGPSDYANVNKLQAQLSLTPLSQWGKTYVPPTNGSVSSSIDMKTPPPRKSPRWMRKHSSPGSRRLWVNILRLPQRADGGGARHAWHRAGQTVRPQQGRPDRGGGFESGC